ncbi:hypothetical protein G5I_04269 [Acromyrmex echinatior]|uniref:Uncharacterized protein n=1 Tax=Acromyrmex echinatior TaxID=103372 RepID=F4WF62_ACREC|nr:hypothetical protein G5I_04269 [Acromyrmex echinatior]
MAMVMSMQLQLAVQAGRVAKFFYNNVILKQTSHIPQRTGGLKGIGGNLLGGIEFLIVEIAHRLPEFLNFILLILLILATDRRCGEDGERTDGIAYTACLRACMATYRKLRRPGDGEAEIGERSRRRKLNEDEEDAEEAAVHERVTGETGEDTDRPRRSNLRRTAAARRTERWKSILWNRSVFLKPCFELRPSEVRRRIFATLVLGAFAEYFVFSTNQKYKIVRMHQNVTYKVQQYLGYGKVMSLRN